MERVEKMDDSELDRFARTARAAVVREFSWDIAAEKLERLYLESLAAKP